MKIEYVSGYITCDIEYNNTNSAYLWQTCNPSISHGYSFELKLNNEFFFFYVKFPRKRHKCRMRMKYLSKWSIYFLICILIITLTFAMFLITIPALQN